MVSHVFIYTISVKQKKKLLNVLAPELVGFDENSGISNKWSPTKDEVFFLPGVEFQT